MQSLDTNLLELLAEWEHRRNIDDPISVEALADGNEALAAQLRAAIELLCQLDWMAEQDSQRKSPVSILLDAAQASAANIPPIEHPQLGPYDLLERLGQGGMGTVFKARHRRLNKFVAIKMLPSHLSGCLHALARFEQEIKAIGSLEHPNIVRALDANEDQGTHYLVMEYVEGEDLHQLVKLYGPLPVEEACRVIRDAAQALAYAHQLNLIHRDIKPSNLLLTKGGDVKVLDLGLARIATEAMAESGLTSSNASLGTPDYMAPEQWADARRVGTTTDLYSLGCTLYFLLVGHAPFATNMYRTLLGKMAGHAEGVIPALRDSLPEVPAELEAIYQQLLAKDPAVRLSSARELAERLDAFCPANTRPLQLPPPLPVGTERAVAKLELENDANQVSATPAVAKVGASSGRRWLLVTVLGLIVLALVVGWLVWRLGNLPKAATAAPLGTSFVATIENKRERTWFLTSAGPAKRWKNSPGILNVILDSPANDPDWFIPPWIFHRQPDDSCWLEPAVDRGWFLSAAKLSHRSTFDPNPLNVLVESPAGNPDWSISSWRIIANSDESVAIESVDLPGHYLHLAADEPKLGDGSWSNVKLAPADSPAQADHWFIRLEKNSGQ